MRYEYPLRWPEGWRKPFFLQSGRIRASLAMTLALLHARVENAPWGDSAVLSSHLPLLEDGTPMLGWNPSDPTVALYFERMGGKTPEPGVALYFERNGKPMVIACGAYKTVAANVMMVAGIVEKLREFRSVAGFADRAYKGFELAREPDTTKEQP